MAAATIVVRERFATSEPDPTPDVPAEGPAWDVTAVTVEDLTLVRRFLDRARSLPADRREQIASQIAAKLRRRVTSPEPIPDDEQFLRALYAHTRRR